MLRRNCSLHLSVKRQFKRRLKFNPTKKTENDAWKGDHLYKDYVVVYILRDISYDDLKFCASSNHNMFIFVLAMFSFRCHETQKSGLV